MSNISFPANPALGQQYTFASKAWQWNGFAWDLMSISDAQVQAAANSAAAAAASAAAMQVPDYAGLRAVTANIQTVVVTGYLAASSPSGIAGLFTRDDSDTTSPDNGGTVLVAANGKRWKRSLQDGRLSSAWFGTSPLNTAAQNDAAFAAACAAIMSLNGGTLVVPPGLYQTCHQTPGVNGAFGNTDAIVIHGCTRPVVLEGYGAVLIQPNGQKFGSFDPTTGLPYNPPALPFWNNAYAGHPGRFIYCYGNSSVLIRGFELNGNCSSYVVGGQYGDTGYQIIGNGIELDGNGSAVILDAYIHHCGLDAIDLKWDGLTDSSAPCPVRIENVKGEYNVRQGLSFEGGIELDVLNSRFNHTGRSVNQGTGQRMYSSPGAGIDIEPIASTVGRNIRIRGTECVNNVGYGLASDNGNAAYIRLDDCLLWGTTNYPMKPTHPYTEIHHCRVIGQWIGPNSGDERSATKIYNTDFSDIPWSDGNVCGKGGGGYLVNLGSVKGVILRDCSITASFQKLADIRDAVVERVTMQQVYGGLADQSDVANLLGSSLRDVKIIDAVAAPTANGYYVQINNFQSVSGRCEITYAGAAGKLKWSTWDGSNGGFQGVYGVQSDTLSQAVRFLILHKNYGANNFSGNMQIISGTTAPNFGTWNQGDRCWNSAPAVGQPKGWICTVSGSPGTWVSEGNL